MFCPLIHNNFRILLTQMLIFMVTYGHHKYQCELQYHPERNAWSAQVKDRGRQLWHYGFRLLAPPLTKSRFAIDYSMDY